MPVSWLLPILIYYKVCFTPRNVVLSKLEAVIEDISVQGYNQFITDYTFIYIYMDVALYEMLSISWHFFSLIYPSYFISINETMKWVFKVLSNNITDIATRFIALVAIQVMPVLQAYSMWATYVISTFKTVVILDIFYQRKWYTNKHTDSKWTEHRHYTYQ